MKVGCLPRTAAGRAGRNHRWSPANGQYRIRRRGSGGLHGNEGRYKYKAGEHPDAGTPALMLRSSEAVTRGRITCPFVGLSGEGAEEEREERRRVKEESIIIVCPFVPSSNIWVSRTCDASSNLFDVQITHLSAPCSSNMHSGSLCRHALAPLLDG